MPAARAEHDYGFAKGDYKWFLLERNRWWTVLAAYPAPLLALGAARLLAFDLALLPVAARGGWLRREAPRPARRPAHAAVGAARRRRVQARRVAARRSPAALTASLDSPVIAAASRSRVLRTAQSGFWRGVLAVIR